MAPLDLRCPTCGFADEVRKVTVVLEESVTVVHGEYGTYTYPTALTKALARPTKPTRDNSGFYGMLLGLLFVVFGFGGLISQRGDMVLSVGLLVMGLIFGFAGYSVEGTAKKRYQDMSDRWPKPEERWNQLYYCRRDATVFNPVDGASMSVEGVKPYLDSGPPQ